MHNVTIPQLTLLQENSIFILNIYTVTHLALQMSSTIFQHFLHTSLALLFEIITFLCLPSRLQGFQELSS